MTNLCIGDPSQCFQIPISFNYYETILNFKHLNINEDKNERRTDEI